MRGLASVAFSKGGVGNPEGVEGGRAFLAEGCDSFELYWEVQGNVRGWESCGLASVVFSLLCLGLWGGLQRSTITGIVAGINSRYIRKIEIAHISQSYHSFRFLRAELRMA